MSLFILNNTYRFLEDIFSLNNQEFSQYTADLRSVLSVILLLGCTSTRSRPLVFVFYPSEEVSLF